MTAEVSNAIRSAVVVAKSNAESVHDKEDRRARVRSRAEGGEEVAHHYHQYKHYHH